MSKTSAPSSNAPPAAKPGAALLDRILAPANLAAAWEAVAANAGAAGVDEVGIRRFGRTWEARVTRLAEDVRGARYKPGRLRVVFIPKRGDGLRRISIPTVADRVLQRAALEVLLPHFDRKFLACSYGYRPKRGVAQAVAAAIHYHDRGLRAVLEADIDDCFGSLDHEILLKLVEQEVHDWRVLQLMRWWLNVGRPIKNQAVGIALGMPISPLWANIYLHELDWRLVRNRWALVRYADDFVVLTDSAAAAERVHALVADTLAGLQLRLEPSKSRVSSFSDGFEFLGVHFQGNEFNPCQRTTGARPLQVCQCTCEQLTGRCLYCRRMAVGGSTSERVSPAKPSSTGLPCADSPWPGCPARASRRWPCWRYRWPVRLSSARTPYQSPGCTGARSLCSNG